MNMFVEFTETFCSKLEKAILHKTDIFQRIECQI